jgi:hypothetical protein
MALEFSEEFLKDLLDEVTNELNGETKKQVAKLAKSEDSAEQTSGDSASEGAESKDVPAPDMNNDGKIGDLDGKPEAPNDVSNAATVEDANAPTDAKADSLDAVDADLSNGDDSSPGIDALKAQYEALNDECLHDHFLACKEAILARMGVDEESAEDDQQLMDAPPAPDAAPAMDAAPAPAAAPPAPAPEAPELGKKEPSMKKDLGTKGTTTPAPVAGAALKPPAVTPMPPATEGADVKSPVIKAMNKSEAELEIESLKARLAKQEEETLQLIETIAIPMRKSIKGVSEIGYIAKTESAKNLPVMTKEKAISTLREKARSEDLKKSDRSLINGYCLGNVKYEEIAHLLTDVK